MCLSCLDPTIENFFCKIFVWAHGERGSFFYLRIRRERETRSLEDPTTQDPERGGSPLPSPTLPYRDQGEKWLRYAQRWLPIVMGAAHTQYTHDIIHCLRWSHAQCACDADLTMPIMPMYVCLECVRRDISGGHSCRAHVGVVPYTSSSYIKKLRH